MIFFIFVPVILVVLFLFTKERNPGTLRPVGGPRWKNYFAWLLIKAGRAAGENRIIPELANRRVPVPPGKTEEDYNDSFVFQGSDDKGNLLMTRLGFREGGKYAEVWVWMILGGKKYHIAEDIHHLDMKNQEGICAGGLEFHCPDESEWNWNIRYRGPLEPGKAGCEMDLQFSPSSRVYHSGVHMNMRTFAKSMAEMHWNRAYFKSLRSESQCRVEQGGRLAGNIRIDAVEHTISMLSIRDHSWGKRNWNFINRYIWNVLSLESPMQLGGKEYRYLVYTTVDYGTTFRHLASGWIGGPDSILPITAASDMAETGGDGNIPETFSCRFMPLGEKVLTLTVRRCEPSHSWYMQNKTFEVCEAYCIFELEGCKGVGMSEFGYALTRGYHRDPGV